MDEPATSGPERILVIGRSPGVILDAAGILRSKGFHADATNQFDEVLTEYDTTNIDVVVFGGMVPPDAKQHLTRRDLQGQRPRHLRAGTRRNRQASSPPRSRASRRLPETTTAWPTTRRTRTVQLTLQEPAQVVVEAWWATSFTPPEPTSTSMRVIDSHFDPGEYFIPLPAEVPPVASFVTVSVGPAVRAFTVGAMPEAVMRVGSTRDPTQPPALPPVRAVATHHTD